MRHINKSAKIDGLIRKEQYELPVGAVREMIIDAQCHRNFMDNSCVQVALYDDRLEVTSPGMLYGGLTLEEALSGRSKIRNRAVAEVFSRMELIEEWGTGIRRILKRAGEYGLKEMFRVNLYRLNGKKPIKKADKKADKKPITTERQQQIITYIKKYRSISNKEARELLNLADSTTKRILKQMVEEGILQVEGERKGRVYKLK